MNGEEGDSSSHLSDRERGWVATLGAVVILLATAALYLAPPKTTVSETQGEVSIETSQADQKTSQDLSRGAGVRAPKIAGYKKAKAGQSTPTVTKPISGNSRETVQEPLTALAGTLMAFGVGLFFWAVNGRRFTRFSAGGISLDTPLESAQRFAQENPDLLGNADIPPGAPHAKIRDATVVTADTTPPKPVRSPRGDVKLAKGSVLEVFGLEGTPARVLAVAQDHDAERPPLSAFQFALRRKEGGAHPWLVKFRGRPLVVVRGPD